MQEHPVPQNVTQFEFHLVGDMTIKQFGYLGSGLGLAYLIFVSLAAKAPFVAYPLMVMTSLVGVAFAFLPYQDRPLDHWLKAYFGAIFSPTKAQYKSKVIAPEEKGFDERIKLYLHEEPEVAVPASPHLGTAAQMAPATQAVVVEAVATPMPPAVALSNPAPVAAPVRPVNVAPVPTPVPMAAPVNAVSPTPEQKQDVDLGKVVQYAEEAQILQTQIMGAQKELEAIKAKASGGGVGAQQLNADFQKVLGRLETFNNQAKIISGELNRLTSAPTGAELFKPSLAPTVPTVKIGIDSLEKYTSLTSVENILNGIVYDSLDNYLPGVIVVTHDKDGLPVRALKTNKLGQFLAATPLSNGTYTLTFEKENLAFDVVELELSGKVLPAIKITAKKVGGS